MNITERDMMILELIISATCCLLVLLLAIVMITFFQQYKINQYFKKISPNLPIAEDEMSVYGGHSQCFFNKRNVFIVDKLHKKYGKTIGVYFAKKPAVATTDLDLIKAVVLDEPDKNINRGKLYIPSREIEVDSIATAYDDQWRRLRRATAPAFTNHKIKSSSNVLNQIKSTIDRFVKSIEKRIDDDKSFTTIDADDIFHRYTMDLIFRCFFKQDNLIDYDANTDRRVLMYNNFVKSINYSLWNIYINFPLLKKLLNLYINKFVKKSGLRKFIASLTKLNLIARNELKRAKLEAERSNSKFDPDNFTLSDGTKYERNLFDYFTDHYLDKKITENEYYNTGAFLFSAADKATADAITLTIYHLALDQNIQNKLRNSLLKDGEESEYLHYCILESVRLFPPVPIGCTRILEDDYTTKEGYFIPKGTMLLTSTYTIHRSTEYWGDDALEYNPDRWYKSDDFHPCQFIGFGLGKRSCLGKAFALHNTKVLLNSLIKKFKFESSPLNTNKNLFESPCYIFVNYDQPHYVRVCKI